MRKWVLFWILGLIWGSSFLLIRVGVEAFSPFQIVFMRTLIAAVGLNIVLLAQGKHLPLNLREMLPLIIIGVGNTTIPFALITWSETSIESGLAAVLQSSASLFAMVLAHFTFVDERMTPQKVAGLALGFVGVIVLGSRNWVNGQVITGSLGGYFGMILASLFYASFTTYSRKVIQGKFEPIVVSTGAMTSAAVSSGILMVIAPLLGGQAATPLNAVEPKVLGAVLLLGFLNTFIAYLIFYGLVRELGSARTQMVTYVVPMVGLILGVLILNEQMDERILVGAALIFLGIGVVNVRLKRASTAAREHGVRYNPAINDFHRKNNSAKEIKKALAAAYSPTPSPGQYHPRS